MSDIHACRQLAVRTFFQLASLERYAPLSSRIFHILRGPIHLFSILTEEHPFFVEVWADSEGGAGGHTVSLSWMTYP